MIFMSTTIAPRPLTPLELSNRAFNGRCQCTLISPGSGLGGFCLCEGELERRG